jgi:LacI family transcriptional regulator
LATEHLIEVGRRRIAHIGGRDISTATDRLRGYRHALIRNGLSESPEYVVCPSNANDAGDQAGYDAMKLALALKPRPDAVFCFNDPLAMGAMEAAIDAGLEIPHDIAIIGCGNIKYSRMLRIPLSSIDQNSEVVGEDAATLALEITASKSPIPPRVVLQRPTLVARASTVGATGVVNR